MTDQSSPVFIAHRGMSRQYPENTMPAFRAAIDAGADMIELDVALSSDGVLVVIHDDTLLRTTEGSGFVCHHTSKDIQSLDAGHWFGAEQGSIRVPDLDEVLEEVAGKIALNIEVKPFFPLNQSGRMQAALSRLVTLLDERGLREQTILSSVNFFLLEYIRELDDEIRLGLIFRRPLTDFDPVVVCQALKAYSLHPWQMQMTAELVQAMHHVGVKVFPYTVNTVEQFDTVMAKKADGIFTDCPDELRSYFESKAA